MTAAEIMAAINAGHVDGESLDQIIDVAVSRRRAIAASQDAFAAAQIMLGDHVIVEPVGDRVSKWDGACGVVEARKGRGKLLVRLSFPNHHRGIGLTCPAGHLTKIEAPQAQGVAS